jgi:PTH1 family peptidyl-tRNA hydrolase
MSRLKIIAGLGNPGEEYSRTRHNIGFWVMETLAERWSFSWKKGRFNSLLAKGKYKDFECLLVEPQTFMNRSGEAITPLLDFYRVSLEDLIVFHDDLDLPLGRLKIKSGGGDGGHRGIRSLMESLSSGEFIRFRLGIGRPPQRVDPVEYVLRPWENEEKKELPEVIQKGIEALEYFLDKGLEAAMNRYHA